MPDETSEEHDRWKHVAGAWAVHGYTSLGLVLGLCMLIATSAGRATETFFLMALACIIDTTDGALARRLRVTYWAPQFDGRKLDDISDFITYTFVPVFFVYRFELIPSSWIIILAIVLLASAYGFCQDRAKTEDGFFTGFPSYWNVAVFYCYILNWPPLVVGLALLLLSALVFVPIKYYSSKTRELRTLTFGLALAWAGLVLYLMLHADQANPLLGYLSLLFPAYYVAVSLYLQFRRPLARQAENTGQTV